MSLVLHGRGDDAEKLLKEITADGNEDAHRWSTVRAANLIWILGRPADAAAILEGLGAGPESPTQAASRTAVEACVDAVYGHCQLAAEKASAALNSEQLGDFHAMMASFALVMSLGALGRGDELAAVADRALDRASTSFQTAPLRFWFGGVFARACRLTGRIDDCAKVAKQMADSVNDVPGLAYANLVFLLGQSDLMRGELPDAVKLLHEALAGVEHHGITTGLRPATCFALTEAHAKLGESAEANAALEEARANVPDTYVYMHTALAIATGWALAAGGYLSDAVTTVRDAAAKARDRGQPTHELLCLQVAAQWGDAAMSDRARELAGELSLPLADAVARHAESLATKDGEGCCWRPTAIGRWVTGRLPPMRPRRRRWPSRRANSADAGCTPPRSPRDCPTNAVASALPHCAARPVIRSPSGSVKSSNWPWRACPTRTLRKSSTCRSAAWRDTCTAHVNASAPTRVRNWPPSSERARPQRIDVAQYRRCGNTRNGIRVTELFLPVAQIYCASGDLVRVELRVQTGMRSMANSEGE